WQENTNCPHYQRRSAAHPEQRADERRWMKVGIGHGTDLLTGPSVVAAKARRAAPAAARHHCVPLSMFRPIIQNSAAIRPAAGMVRTQATSRFMVTAQRTAFTSCAVPTPTIAPVIVCVVETGTPAIVASARLRAPPIDAQDPLTGVSLVIFEPMVFTMRQPPR